MDDDYERKIVHYPIRGPYKDFFDNMDRRLRKKYEYTGSMGNGYKNIEPLLQPRSGFPGFGIPGLDYKKK